MVDATLYEKDFYEWAINNAELLRKGRLSEIDVDNIAEEIESMGRSMKRALKRRLEVLLTHLLKWEFQEDFRTKSWSYTIIEQRRAIQDLLNEAPSLKPLAHEFLDTAYKRARADASEEAELKPNTFPDTCPWLLEQVLDDDFLPE